MSNSTDTTNAGTTNAGTDLDAVVDGYLAGWNTTDAAERADLVARWWSGDARMTDPLVDVAGHAELAAVFERFHETYPGCSFRRAGGHDAHHALIRWGWEMVDPTGAVVSRASTSPCSPTTAGSRTSPGSSAPCRADRSRRAQDARHSTRRMDGSSCSTSSVS